MEKFIISALFLVALLFWILYMYKKVRKIKIPHTENDLEKALKDSDDYILWEYQFTSAAKNLIARGFITLEDFQWSGGWTRSTNKLLDYPYFVVPKKDCTVKHRIYLDVLSGRIFQSYKGKTRYIRFKEEDS